MSKTEVKVWVEKESSVKLYLVPTEYLEKILPLIAEYECKPEDKKSGSGNTDQ